MSLNGDSPPAPTPRRTVSLTLVVVVAVLVAAGAAGATAVYFELKPASSTHSGVTVTDDLGRTVTVPSDPSRVVVLGPSIMDTVYRLGMRSHVVGVDCSNASLGGLEGDYLPDQVTLWNLSSSMCVLAYPTVSTADLLNMNPQLVLVSTIIEVSGMEQFSATYGIPVVFYDPNTLDDILYDVQMTAEIFGTTTAGAHVIAQLQDAILASYSFISNLSDNGTPLRSVLLLYDAVPAGSPYAGYYTYGPGSFGQSLIEFIGGTNAAQNSSTPYPALSGSQLLYDDPSWIIYGNGFGVDLSTYQSGPDWSSVPAVAAGNLTGVDVSLMTEPDPTMLLSLGTFLQVLYPELPGA
jgi:iron complex transport system substrate-binding protein